MSVILRVQKSDLEKCLDVIQRSFQTVADDFGFTEENCPGHTSFMKLDRLERDFDFGNPMYAYMEDGRCAGFASIRPREDDSCEMKTLCVLPEYRHKGIGRALFEHVKQVAKDELKKDKLTIGIVDESAVLKSWYEDLGFIHTGTQKYEHLPFTVGFMEMPL
jgi:ribosomal protein S18 acetylase RimI-like enzyme